MAGQIKKVKKGDPISADDFNALIDEVMRLGKISADAPLNVINGPGGVAFSISTQRRSVFPVKLTKTGGSAGNKTTQCSFSYTVKDYTGSTTLATSKGLTGNGQRVVNAQMTEGTLGLAYYDGGTLKLIWADERFDQKNCT